MMLLVYETGAYLIINDLSIYKIGAFVLKDKLSLRSKESIASR